MPRATITLPDGRRVTITSTRDITADEIQEVEDHFLGPPQGPSLKATLATTALRVVPPLVATGVAALTSGGAALPIAAAGLVSSVGGELAAEGVEKTTGRRKHLSIPQLVTQGTLGAMPAIGQFRHLQPVARTAARLGLGATMGTTGVAATELAEGRRPTTGELIAGATVGTFLAGLTTRGIRGAERARAQPARVLQQKIDEFTKMDERTRLALLNASGAPTPPHTAPTPSAGQWPTAQPAAIMEPALTVEATKRITGAAAEVPEVILNTPAGRKLYQKVALAIDEGTIDAETIFSVAEREGLTGKDMAVVLLATVRPSAQRMRAFRTLADQLKKFSDRNPLAREIMDELGDGVKHMGGWERASRALAEMDDVSRIAAVGQMATAARNGLSQAARASMEIFDVAAQDVLLGQGAKQATRDAILYITRFGQMLSRNQQRDFDAILKNHFPFENARLFRSTVGELRVGRRFYHAINIFNQVQENFYRRAVAKATIDRELLRRGIDIHEAWAINPDLIPDEVMRLGVQRALEVTFAANPRPGGPGAAWITGWHAFRPLMTTINPYPRFLANAWKFLIDFNPSGYFKLMGKSAEDTLLADPRRAAEIVSRATTGTYLLAGGLAVRAHPDLAGPKWYQVRVPHFDGEDPDKQGYVDMRPFAPFSTYLFLAEVMQNAGRHGTDWSQWNLTTGDVLQGVASINRIAGTGLVLADLIRARADLTPRILADLASQYVGRFTVPFNTISDFIATTHPEEGLFRDTKEGLQKIRVGGHEIDLARVAGTKVPGKVLGGPFANLPGAKRLLEESRSPLRTEPMRKEKPGLRQLTGLTVQRLNPLEREVAEIGFTSAWPRTGVPAADRFISERVAAQLVGPLSNLVSQKRWASLEPEVRRVALGVFFSEARRSAREQLEREQPELARAVKFRAQPGDIRALAIRRHPELRELLLR